MEPGTTAVRVPVKVSIIIQIGEGRRVRLPLVESANLRGGRGIRLLAWLCVVHYGIPEEELTRWRMTLLPAGRP
jgi:hypothetical protein